MSILTRPHTSNDLRRLRVLTLLVIRTLLRLRLDIQTSLLGSYMRKSV